MRIMIKEPGKAPSSIVIDRSLKTMQQLVGGLIEHVKITDRIGLLVNEEGKLKGLESNFYLEKFNDMIVGTALFIGDNGEDFTSLTEADMDYIRANFGSK